MSDNLPGMSRQEAELIVCAVTQDISFSNGTPDRMTLLPSGSSIILNQFGGKVHTALKTLWPDMGLIRTQGSYFTEEGIFDEIQNPLLGNARMGEVESMQKRIKMRGESLPQLFCVVNKGREAKDRQEAIRREQIEEGLQGAFEKALDEEPIQGLDVAMKNFCDAIDNMIPGTHIDGRERSKLMAAYLRAKKAMHRAELNSFEGSNFGEGGEHNYEEDKDRSLKPAIAILYKTVEDIIALRSGQKGKRLGG